MKQIEKIASAENFDAVALGRMAGLGDYAVALSPEVSVPGKVFAGSALNATGAEISFQSFAPGTQTGFLHAHRSHLAGDVCGIVEADRYAFETRTGGEGRLMTCRMGRKLAELATLLVDDAAMSRWLDDAKRGAVEGSYPVAQGILFAACGIAERGLVASHCYGSANMVLGAALRCVRVSHYDTQRILYRLSGQADAIYDEISDMEIDEMHAFAPQADILASMHEKGSSRMFMN